MVAFGPHPDDIEMGCGGTLIKLRKKGYKVGTIDLTGGEMGTRGSAALREREAKKAAEILGVSFRDNLNLADGHLWNTDESREKVIKSLRTLA